MPQDNIKRAIMRGTGELDGGQIDEIMFEGYGLGLAGAWGIRLWYPVFPAYPPPWAVAAAVITALTTGLLFGIMPARRAALMDPVQALMKH